MRDKLTRELSTIPARATLRLVFLQYASIPNTNPTIPIKKSKGCRNLDRSPNMYLSGSLKSDGRSNQSRIMSKETIKSIQPITSDAIAMLTIP